MNNREALERVKKYIDETRKMIGHDPEVLTMANGHKLLASDLLLLAALASQVQQPNQEPLLTLILGGIEGNEYAENDVECHTKAIEALQEKLVHGSDAVFVPLYLQSQAQQEPSKTKHHPICDGRYPSLCDACNAEAKEESQAQQLDHIGDSNEMVQEPYAYDVPTEDGTELAYAIYYTKYNNPLPEGATPLYISQQEPAKAPTADLIKVFDDYMNRTFKRGLLKSNLYTWDEMASSFYYGALQSKARQEPTLPLLRMSEFPEQITGNVLMAVDGEIFSFKEIQPEGRKRWFYSAVKGAVPIDEFVGRLPVSESSPAVEPIESKKVWCNYIATMIGAYLNEPVDSDKCKAIAGIIERRLWSFPVKEV